MVFNSRPVALFCLASSKSGYDQRDRHLLFSMGEIPVYYIVTPTVPEPAPEKVKKSRRRGKKKAAPKKLEKHWQKELVGLPAAQQEGVIRGGSEAVDRFVRESRKRMHDQKSDDRQNKHRN